MSKKLIVIIAGLVVLIAAGFIVSKKISESKPALGQKHIKCTDLKTGEVSYQPHGELVKTSGEEEEPQYEILFHDEDKFDMVLINQECEESAFKVD